MLEKDLQSIQEARSLLKSAKEAQQILNKYSQQEVDRLVALMAEAGYRASKELAILACQDSGLGKLESKIEKNRFATRNIYEYIKDLKTVGVIREDLQKQLWEIATPMGVVVAIVPITNPTSTALFKILISIKARCAVVLSPHPKGVNCVNACAEVMRKAISSVGAPEGLIGCLQTPTMAATEELMKHRDTDVILATGGSGLVHAAYSSGKPAIGVGPGNVPAFIEKTADIAHAVRCLVVSQGFDWGTLCCSEQSLVIERSIAKQCLAELSAQKAYVCNPQETKLLEKLMPPGSTINPDLVGQSPNFIAQKAGFSVPQDTTILIAEQQGVGDKHPLSREKLAPILSLYFVDNWESGCEKCLEVLRYGGMGHTLVLHSKNQSIVSAFALKKPAYRLLVNAPGSQGAVGYATPLPPSMTLGCGTSGGNITSDNITPMHLLNIKRLAYGKSSIFPDLPTPRLKVTTQQQTELSFRRDPFADEPGKQYYIGPHNNPNI